MGGTSIARIVCTMGVLLSIVLPMPAQVQPEYREIVAMYRAGRFDEAVAAVRMLSAEQIDWHVKLLIGFDATGRAGSPKPISAASRVWIRAALLLHTDLLSVLRHEPGRNGAEFPPHIKAQRAILASLETQPRDAGFLLPWYLMVIADAQGRSDLIEAGALATAARKSFSDDPELLLSIGALHELAWTLEHEEDIRLGFDGSLKDAESAYRAALAGNAGLVEARVRLGRVLTWRNDLAGALQTLAAARAGTTEEGFVYLAALFEGDVHERQGDLVRAAQSYEAAIQAMPASQSARIALAHARHAEGNRPEAFNRITELASEKRKTDDTADPWVWYIRGTAWRAPGYRELLRGMVKP